MIAPGVRAKYKPPEMFRASLTFQLSPSLGSSG